MELGADGVEMDVQQTSDAGLVIHHDYMIDLHTDISGKIYDMTMGDLKTLDFGSWKDVLFKDEKIATLQEAMELCRQMPGCTVHLELKSTMDNDPDFVPRVLEVLQQTEMVEQVILVSFNHALLRQAKQLLPELRVGALVYGELESLLLPPPIIWKDLGLTNGMDEMGGKALIQSVAVAHAALSEQKFLPGQLFQRNDFLPGKRVSRRCNKTHRLRHIRRKHQIGLQQGLVQRIGQIDLICAQHLQHSVGSGGAQHQLHLRAQGVVAFEQTGQEGGAHRIRQRDAQTAADLPGGLQGSLRLLGRGQQGACIA